MMYLVRRQPNKIEIVQRNGEVIYSGTGEEYLVYRENPNQNLEAKQVSEMSDPELLIALANSVRLPHVMRREREPEK